jgi:molybdopterin converting factor small subunit
MIRIQAFARYRSILGWDARELPLPSPPTLAALLADPLFKDLPDESLFAVNQAFAPREAVLEDGDQVALFPPVSGG